MQVTPGNRPDTAVGLKLGVLARRGEPTLESEVKAKAIVARHADGVQEATMPTPQREQPQKNEAGWARSRGQKAPAVERVDSGATMPIGT